MNNYDSQYSGLEMKQKINALIIEIKKNTILNYKRERGDLTDPFLAFSAHKKLYSSKVRSRAISDDISSNETEWDDEEDIKKAMRYRKLSKRVSVKKDYRKFNFN